MALFLEQLHALELNTKVGMNKVIFERYLAQRQMLFPTPRISGTHLGLHMDLLASPVSW